MFCIIYRSTEIVRGDNVIDFEDHLDNLGGQLELLSLGVQGFIDFLFLHVDGTHIHAIDSKSWVVL